MSINPATQTSTINPSALLMLTNNFNLLSDEVTLILLGNFEDSILQSVIKIVNSTRLSEYQTIVGDRLRQYDVIQGGDDVDALITEYASPATIKLP
jgi:hypothetical protein